MYSDTYMLRRQAYEVGSEANTYDRARERLRNSADEFESESSSLDNIDYTEDVPRSLKNKINNLGAQAKSYNRSISDKATRAGRLSIGVDEFKSGVLDIIDTIDDVDYEAYQIFLKAHEKINAVDSAKVTAVVHKTSKLSNTAAASAFSDTSSTLSSTSSTKSSTSNTTGLYIDYTDSNGRRHYQDNGSQYTYNFSAKFNQELDDIAADVIGSITSNNLSTEEKAYLQKLLPYIIKGIGASESSWSDSSQGYVGLTSAGMSGLQYLASTFGNKTYDTDISSYNTPEKGADIAARMFVHWVDYYKYKYPNASIEQVIWYAWGGAGSSSYTGGYANAAYQAGMAAAFYKQDNDGDELFSKELRYVTNHLSEYGVQYSSNKKQTATSNV
jgi:hypothetical protein